MASIQCFEDFTIVSSFATINVYSEKSEFSLKIPTTKPKGDAKNKDTPLNDSSDVKSRILCMTLSKNGQYFAASDDDKNLAVWETKQPVWPLISCKTVVRKAVCIRFMSSNKLLLADKAGDVYDIDVINGKDDAKLVPLMGHISMLLDMNLSEDEKFLITCDRDEKIRISHFPNCYNIECYCLGHTEYVIRTFVLPDCPEVLVSGSGDGTVRFWSIKDGRELAKIICENKTLGIDSTDLPSASSNHNSSSKIQRDSNPTAEMYKTAIKSLKYSIKNKVLAVLYAARYEVSLYFVKNKNKLEYHHIQNISFSDEIWDADFDKKGFLWILIANPDEIIHLYQPFLSEKIQFVLMTSLPNETQFTVDSIKHNRDFFKESLDVKNEHYTLFKQWYDNVKIYYEKKEERLSHSSKKIKTSRNSNAICI